MTNPTEPTPSTTPHDTVRDTLVRVRTWLAQTAHAHYRGSRPDDCARCLVPEIDAALAARPAPDTITTPDQLDAPFFRDTTTGEPCPRRGRLMCTITARDHLHRAIHMDAPARGSADAETLRADLIAERADLLESNKALRAEVERTAEAAPGSDGAWCTGCGAGLVKTHAALEDLRAEVERLRALTVRTEQADGKVIDILQAERDAARTEAAMWRERAEVGRGMVQNACTEAATLRTAIEAELHHSEDNGFRIEHLDGPGEHVAAVPIRYIRAVLESHPAPEAARRRCTCDRVGSGSVAHTPECDGGAPEAAPPTLTVTWDALYASVLSAMSEEDDRASDAGYLAGLQALARVATDAAARALGVTVVDAEAGRA